MTRGKMKSYTIEKFRDDKCYSIWGNFEPNHIVKLVSLSPTAGVTEKQMTAIAHAMRLDGLDARIFDKEADKCQ